MYIDTHAHLNCSQFDFVPKTDEFSVESIVNIAVTENVKILNICITPDDWLLLESGKFNFPNIYNIAGIHPDEVNPDTIKYLSVIEKFAGKGQLVGIGETGLDYYRSRQNRDLQ